MRLSTKEGPAAEIEGERRLYPIDECSNFFEPVFLKAINFNFATFIWWFRTSMVGCYNSHLEAFALFIF